MVACTLISPLLISSNGLFRNIKLSCRLLCLYYISIHNLLKKLTVHYHCYRHRHHHHLTSVIIIIMTVIIHHYRVPSTWPSEALCNQNRSQLPFIACACTIHIHSQISWNIHHRYIRPGHHQLCYPAVPKKEREGMYSCIDR